MASFVYWDDCADPQDIKDMWKVPEVSTEWLEAGESKDQKVHMSRDPDGQPYLTQTEMRAVAVITVQRHFDYHTHPDMICAIAELASDRQPLTTRYDKKKKHTTIGLMQILPKTAEWLVRDLGYRSYNIQGDPVLLCRPFVNVYLGAAYLNWLLNFEKKERGEEFIVRAYYGGTEKATHKSTLQYWQRYLVVKESLPSRRFSDKCSVNNPIASAASAFNIPSVHTSESSGGHSRKKSTGADDLYWDSRASPENMAEMWNHPDVSKQWTKSGERRGKVRFSLDKQKRPQLTKVEVKAVAELILSKHFSTRGVNPSYVAALAELVSERLLYGNGPRPGIMGINYSTAFWLYSEMGYRAYRVESDDDVTKPFVSMYFGAAFLSCLSEYEGRQRTPQFVVQAYISGPENVNLDDTGPLWLKFMQALSNYDDINRDPGNCSIL